MIDVQPDSQEVHIRKQCFWYMVNNTLCEVGNVLINETEIDDIKKQ